MKRTLLLIGALAGVGLLVYHFSRQYKMLLDYGYKLSGYKIHKLGFPTRIELFLALENKSDIDVTIDKYLINVNVNGTYITTVKSDNVQELKAKSTSLFSLELTIDPKTVLKNIFSTNFIGSFSLDKSKMIIGIDGAFSVSHRKTLRFQNIPISLKMPLSEMTGS